MQGSCEILNMGDGVPIKDCGVIEGTEIAVFFCTMCRGETKLLDDGLMLPNSIMCSNYWRAILRYCGGSRGGRAHTGGPFVSMWRVTSCWISTSLLYGHVIDENSLSILSYSDTACCGSRERTRDDATNQVMPWTFRSVTESVSR